MTTNRILTKGFWNQHKIILKGFGRNRIPTGTGSLEEPAEIEIPVQRELKFDIREPVEVEMQTDFEVFNSVEKNIGLTFPLNSPLLRVNNYFLDMNLAVAMNKQLSLPLEQRLSYDRLIRMLKAI